MTNAILIFTFSPVQSFIAEARRASDLFVGSQILVQLARAAGKAIQAQGGDLIYPVSEAPDKPDSDVPNKLVARVLWEKVQTTADEAQKALIREWENLANSARTTLMCNWQIKTDARWEAIWIRQTESLWEVYWAAAQMTDDDYARAYRHASAAMDARKRSRVFAPADEEGVKDSLSGCREALHTQNMDAKAYWKSVKIGPPRLRPDGRERLDAIGAIKRSCRLADRRFCSTSTVAAEDFRERAAPYLDDYRAAVEALLRGHLEPVREHPQWPYDGDLLFLETLTADRLADSYGLKQPDRQRLDTARAALRKVYDQIQTHPRPYYAIVALDGDNMGKHIDACLAEGDPEAAHRRLSRQLSQFAECVRQKVAPGFLVYAGGDDMLVLTPLSQALPLAQTLATRFREITGGTASAGIAIAHHLYPLDAALEAARTAERQAKRVTNKAAVCVHVLKRSGERVEIRSRWDAMDTTFEEIASLFQESDDSAGSSLASRFAYEVLQAAYALPRPDDKFESELKRLLKRHRNTQHPHALEPGVWAKRLRTWAEKLPEPPKDLPRKARAPMSFSTQTAELGHWLVLAHFIVQGGVE